VTGFCRKRRDESLRGLATGLLLMLVCGKGCAQDADFEDCILQLIDSAGDDVTVGEIRETCRSATQPQGNGEAASASQETEAADTDESAIDRRLALEGATQEVPFVVTPHKPNYIIYTYNFDKYREELYEQELDENVSFKHSEVDFQISFKVPLWRSIFNTNTHLFAAYTNRSFFQVFEHSAPFREIDHEPEIWLSHFTRWELFGLTGRILQAGFSHQSNGRVGSLSRSWNRVYANAIFEAGDFYFSIKPWWRVQEPESDDDNPDIEDYMGYFEFQGIYKLRDNNLGLMFRNQLKDDYRGALQLDWSVPVTEHLRGYVQYFYGYGNSLIDYNDKVNKLGVGIKLTDWL
jgi:phospholipase A1